MKNRTTDEQKYVETKWSISYMVRYGSQEYAKYAYIFLGFPSDYARPRPDKSEEQDAWHGAFNIIARIEQNWDWKIIDVKYVCIL